MALIKTGGLISEIRGSIGGTTYSRGRYGAIARNRTIPVQPNSARQMVVRNNMKLLINEWNDYMTQAERDGWIQYAAAVPMKNSLGETIYLSGQNHYIRSAMVGLRPQLNQNAIAPTIQNLSIIGTPPVCTIVGATGIMSIAFSNGDSWATEVGGGMIVYAGTPVNAGVKYYSGPWLYATAIKGLVIPPVSPATIDLNTIGLQLATGSVVPLAYRTRRADNRTTEIATLGFVTCS